MSGAKAQSRQGSKEPETSSTLRAWRPGAITPGVPSGRSTKCLGMNLQTTACRNLISAVVLFFSACTLGPVETGAPRSYFLNPEISWNNPG